MKRFKLYIADTDIKSRLGEEYKDSNIIFTSVNIGFDNTVNFEGIVVDSDVPSNDIKRERL